jgi:hypothetical protein
MYETIEAFIEAIQSGKLDPSKLAVNIECGDFFVLDEHDEEVIGGDERDVLPAFFKMLGITKHVEFV